MDSLEIKGGGFVFHRYENGEKVESWDFFNNEFGDIPTNVVRESSLDLTGFEELHVRIESGDDTSYGFKEGLEVPDDHVFDVELVHVILPNKEVWDMINVIDDVIDDCSFETSAGSSFVEYYKVTEEGLEEIEDEDIIEEDDMW